MPHNNRGLALRDLGEFDKALAAYDEAVRLAPNSASAYHNRAWLRATCPDQRFRDGRKALEDAKTACDLHSWKDYRSLTSLAAAYAELGEFNNAIESQRQAIDVAPDADKKKLQPRLELYQAGKPYREAPMRK
jgi:tetratricopeptide (TPR) repeat protein